MSGADAVATGRHGGRGFWIGLALGAPIMAWGAHGALAGSARTHPAELARWIAASAIVHDGLVVPLVLGVGVLARRLVPAVVWPAVRWALATTAVVSLIAWPFVRGYGASPANPTLFPRAYAAGLAIALVAVWAAAGAWALWLTVRGDRPVPHSGPDAGVRDLHDS